MKTPQVAPLAGMSVLGLRQMPAPVPAPAVVVTGSSWTTSESDHLTSSRSCINLECGPECPDRVKERKSTGRFYITMGHAGYNSPANNRDGYASKKAALKASQGYGERGRARGVKSGAVQLCTKCGSIATVGTHCGGQPIRPLTADEAARFIAGGRHALGVKAGA